MKLVLVILCLSPILAESFNDTSPLSPLTTYDQRQTGKFNIHISVKDVQFLSLSDSMGSVGDYDSYPDYDYDGDGDYDESHLTVNPIFSLLGTGGSTIKPKPTTKPTTTTPASSTTTTTASIKANDTKPESHESEDEMPIKESTIIVIKPTQPHNNVSETIPVAAAIDYEEIPVEVQYYRNSNSNNNNNNINNHHQQQQQQKVQLNSRHAQSRYRPRPSVQILGDNTESRNVRIMENNRPAVKICSSSEFRDKYGRCRVRSRRRSGQGGAL
ncbi:unnamed protein product [Diamesa tonsa]